MPNQWEEPRERRAKKQRRNRWNPHLSIVPTFAVNLDKELFEVVSAYHERVRPGEPAILTIRELLWLGAHTPVDEAVHRVIAHEALITLRAYISSEALGFAADLAKRVQSGLHQRFRAQFPKVIGEDEG